MTLPAIDHVGIDTKVRLEVAARLAFPDGSIGLSSLRREARKGRLTIWRVANKDMTTLAEIERMLERCRVKCGPPDSGFDPLAMEDVSRLGSSSTTDASTALAAARMRVERLKASSSSTLPSSTTTPHAAGAARARRQ